MITTLTFKDIRPVPARMLFPDKVVKIVTLGSGKNGDENAFNTKDKKVHDNKIKTAIAKHTWQVAKGWIDPKTDTKGCFERKVYRVDSQ